MELMGALNPKILTRSQKKGALWAINLIKEKLRKTKREDVRRSTIPEILHNQRRRILTKHFPGRFFTGLNHRCTRRKRRGNF